MKRYLKSASIAASVLAVAISCKKQTAPPAGASPYSVVEVAQKDVTTYNAYPANLQGKVNDNVYAKIQGYVQQVLVDEGQRVVKGQPLFKLETNVLNENAAAAKAGISSAKTQADAAQAAVNSAQINVDKLVPLVEKGIISNVQLQSAQASLNQAKAQLASAKAAQQQAVANYQGVQANIDYSVVRASVDGFVGKINFRTGSLVGPSDQQPLTTVSDTNEIYAYFSMNESEYLNFLKESPGATLPEKLRNLPLVDLVLANGETYPEKGKIQAVTGQIDPSTGTIQFRATFPNAAKLLSNGNTGTVRIPKLYPNVLVVPESATFDQQGVTYVYTLKGDTAKNAIVKVQDRVNNLAVISSGVKKGEKIIATGVGTLRDGTLVKPQMVNLDTLVQSIQPVFEND